MKMNKFAAEVHQNAVEHGWWDEERSFGEIIALCHSELSEALEEYRAKRPMVYFVVEMDDGKGGTYLAIREDIISEEDRRGWTRTICCWRLALLPCATSPLPSTAASGTSSHCFTISCLWRMPAGATHPAQAHPPCASQSASAR